MRHAIAFMVLLASFAANAQAVQQCICTAGCKVASNAYVNDASAPTSCNFYKSGVLVTAGAMVSSGTIPLANSTVCTPGDAPYVPGPAGSLACVGNIPAQADKSTVALTVRGVNGAGEALDGGVLTFQSVSQLPTVPPVKAMRVTP